MHINDYHAHIYYNKDTLLRAKELVQVISEKFDVEIGKMHEKPVGPHPMWSCQILFTPNQFSLITQWLIINRNGLTIFLHANTSNDLLDHTEHAIWMGEIVPLDLSIFEK
jgi:aromatic ring-cleaving dioxygenase